MSIREIRFDVNEMRPDRREEMIAWVASLGVEPKDVRPQAVIALGKKSYELHLSRFVRDEAGEMRLDVAINQVVSEPLVVDLGSAPTWPGWLGGVIQ